MLGSGSVQFGPVEVEVEHCCRGKAKTIKAETTTTTTNGFLTLRPERFKNSGRVVLFLLMKIRRERDTQIHIVHTFRYTFSLFKNLMPLATIT